VLEKGKTILLVLLVCSSLVQSYLLAFHSSDFEPILEEDYVETEMLGSQETAENLLFPSQIVLHANAESQTVIYPSHTFYDIIYDDMRKWSFNGIRISAESVNELRMQKSELPGVELQFKSGMPMSILALFPPVEVDFISTVERVQTIWVSLNATGDGVDVHLINEDETAVYEIMNTDLPVSKVMEYVGFGEIQPQYSSYIDSLIIPIEEFAMERLVYKYTSITSEQMENMLFPDPGTNRNLPTRDGTEIYSDGKRGLQIKRDQLWMNYTDPIAPVGDQPSHLEDLKTAVQFVNQRGGWNGRFRISYVAPTLTDQGQRFEFRQYLGDHPVIQQESDLFGYMAVTLQRGTVSEYERSLIMIDPYPSTRTDTKLPGGDVLERRLLEYSNLYNIAAVFPAYKPVITPEYVEFVPIWGIELENGLIEELP
jgi:regulatory protein YycH of two-component signal transduction system YycFG